MLTRKIKIKLFLVPNLNYIRFKEKFSHHMLSAVLLTKFFRSGPFPQSPSAASFVFSGAENAMGGGRETVRSAL